MNVNLCCPEDMFCICAAVDVEVFSVENRFDHNNLSPAVNIYFV